MFIIDSANGSNISGATAGDFVAMWSMYEVKRFKITFVCEGPFLFTCSDTFAVGCVI